MNIKNSVSVNCLTDDEIDRILDDCTEQALLEKATDHLDQCPDCVERIEHLSICQVSEPMRSMFDFNKHADLQSNSDTQIQTLTNDPTQLESREHQDDYPSLNGYEIKELIGRGGMGIVYRARQKGLNRDVAIKMIADGLEAGPERIARFCREAETLARVNHPNVIRIFETGESRGYPFFAMELIPGLNLAQTLDGTPWNNESAAKLTDVAAGAVHAVHQTGIIHRDLKPSNILLNDSSVPNDDFSKIRITDFGLAKSTWQTDLTTTGQAMGTPAYLAPEQAVGQHERVTQATDVYALGCILYELLTGRPPLVASTMAETLRLITDVDPVSPQSLNPSVEKDLATICLHCLHKNPERRYENAEELSADLKRFLDGVPIQARPVSIVEKIWKASRRRPAMAAAMLIASAAAVSLLVIWIIFTNRLAHAKSVAEANSNLAKANFNRAHQAARKYLDSSIQHTPEASSKNLLFQRQLMENGISFYEALIIPNVQAIPASDKPQQIAIRNELAQLLFEYSKVLSISTDRVGAIDALDQALQLCETTETIAEGKDAQSRKIKASVSVASARALASNDDVDRALDAFAIALECYRELEEKQELNPDYLNWYRSVIHKSISGLWLKKGNQSEALESIKRAERFSAKVSKFVPDFQLTRSQVGLAKAGVLRELNQYEAAFTTTEDAFEIIHRVCEQSSPPRIVYEKQRIDCLTHLAELNQVMGQPKKAMNQLDRAIRYQDQLIALHSENESLLIRQLMLLETKSSWLLDQSINVEAINEGIAGLRDRLRSISNDPEKKLISIKLQMQAADRESYRGNPKMSTKYYTDALKLLDSLPDDHDPELQSELKSGLHFRLAERSFAINDYLAAYKHSTEYCSQPGNHSDQLKTILAVSAAMIGELEQAQTVANEIDWSNDSVLVFSGRKYLIEMIKVRSVPGQQIGTVFKQFGSIYSKNLVRGNGNQHLKADLCRAVDWLEASSKNGDEKQTEFVKWAKQTAAQILIDEAIPKFSDGARSLTRDVRFKCLKGVNDFDELIRRLNTH